jgi:hypothetical protein
MVCVVVSGLDEGAEYQDAASVPIRGTHHDHCHDDDVYRNASSVVLPSAPPLDDNNNNDNDDDDMHRKHHNNGNNGHHHHQHHHTPQSPQHPGYYPHDVVLDPSRVAYPPSPREMYAAQMGYVQHNGNQVNKAKTNKTKIERKTHTYACVHTHAHTHTHTFFYSFTIWHRPRL